MIPSRIAIERVMRETGMAEMQAINHLRQRAELQRRARELRQAHFARQAPPRGNRTRISSDDCWPLRDAQGRTWAERKGIV